MTPEERRIQARARELVLRNAAPRVRYASMALQQAMGVREPEQMAMVRRDCNLLQRQRGNAELGLETDEGDEDDDEFYYEDDDDMDYSDGEEYDDEGGNHDETCECRPCRQWRNEATPFSLRTLPPSGDGARGALDGGPLEGRFARPSELSGSNQGSYLSGSTPSSASTIANNDATRARSADLGAPYAGNVPLGLRHLRTWRTTRPGGIHSEAQNHQDSVLRSNAIPADFSTAYRRGYVDVPNIVFSNADDAHAQRNHPAPENIAGPPNPGGLQEPRQHTGTDSDAFL